MKLNETPFFPLYDPLWAHTIQKPQVAFAIIQSLFPSMKKNFRIHQCVALQATGL